MYMLMDLYQPLHQIIKKVDLNRPALWTFEQGTTRSNTSHHSLRSIHKSDRESWQTSQWLNDTKKALFHQLKLSILIEL